MNENMNKKHGTLVPANPIEQSDLAKAFNNRVLPQDWLKSAVGEDSKILTRQSLMQQAEQFLIKILYPIWERGEIIDENIIVELLLRYMKSSLAEGNTLETSYVLGAILNRLDCYAMETLDSVQGPSELLRKDLELLEILSNLNLQEVDRRVGEYLDMS